MGYALKEYLADVRKAQRRRPTAKVGLVAITVLERKRPDIASAISMTSADPRHQNSLPPDFLEAVKARWGNNPPACYD